MRIGIYTENKELIGWKSDSFWSISKSYGKEHDLVGGKIPEHLISNLQGVLNRPSDDGLFNIIRKVNKNTFYKDFETFLIGFAEQGKLTFTHRIFNDTVEELSLEDYERLNYALETQS